MITTFAFGGNDAHTMHVRDLQAAILAKSAVASVVTFTACSGQQR